MLTQARVKELFDYREDGQLIRRISRSSNTKAGDIAGSPNGSGYLITVVDGEDYRNHRLVWLWHYGYIPEYGLDHIDRDPGNNRIENLREASQTCNMRNTGLQRNNTSGVRGVSWSKQAKKWQAMIKIQKKYFGVGYSSCFLEAVCLRLAAEQCINWEQCDIASSAFVFVKECINAKPDRAGSGDIPNTLYA